MANPSLQIGNGKFAIKENDLLGYSSSGAKFFPIPITMTRATLGSRVNPSGLIEDVELLGSELVQDSDFSLTGTQAENVTGTYWTTGAGWSISGGKATLVAQAGSVSLSSAVMSVNAGQRHKVTVNVSATSTGFRLYDSSGVVSYGLNLGENVFYTIPSSSSYQITPLGLAGASGIIDNVSVKEETIDGLARVDYTDGTGSLLVEPQRTNLVTYSEIYGSGTFFTATAGSTIDNTTNVSPSGDTNATQVTSTGQGKVQSGALSLSQNTDYVLSFYAKNVNATVVNSRVFAQGGSGGTNLTSVDYTSQLSTTEWTRITHIFNTGTNTTIYVYLSSSLNIGGTIQLWGAQLEEASYPTSYIKTQGSTVTRNQDQYEKTGISDKINSEEGVLFVEMAALVEVDSARRHITLNDGGASNKVVIRYESTGVITARYDIGGSAQASIAFATTITNSHKIAFKYKVNDFALWVDGTEVGTDTSGSVLSAETINKLSFDSGNGTFPFFGKVKQLQIFKTALSDSELATLTT